MRLSSSSPSFRIIFPCSAPDRLIKRNFVSVSSPDFSLSSASFVTSSTDSSTSVTELTSTVPLLSSTLSVPVSVPSMFNNPYPPKSAAYVTAGVAAVTAATTPARIRFRIEDTYLRFRESEGLYIFFFFIFVLLSFFSFQGTFCYYIFAIFMPIAGIAGLSRDSHSLCVFNVAINKKRFNYRWIESSIALRSDLIVVYQPL